MDNRKSSLGRRRGSKNLLMSESLDHKCIYPCRSADFKPSSRSPGFHYLPLKSFTILPMRSASIFSPFESEPSRAGKHSKAFALLKLPIRELRWKPVLVA